MVDQKFTKVVPKDAAAAAASFEPTLSFRGVVVSKCPHFYAQICVLGKKPEFQIDIVNRINETS